MSRDANANPRASVKITGKRGRQMAILTVDAVHRKLSAERNAAQDSDRDSRDVAVNLFRDSIIIGRYCKPFIFKGRKRTKTHKAIPKSQEKQEY